jgi:hypothetical protein
MELGWGALVLLVTAAAVVWFVQDSLAARERANAAAMEACQRLSLQFLDGTVAFARLSLAREHGRLTLRRTYVFDYTANSIERRQGFIILMGRRVESVGYAAGEERRGQPPPITLSASATFTAEPSAHSRDRTSVRTRDRLHGGTDGRAGDRSRAALPEHPEERDQARPTAQVFDLAAWRERRRAAGQQPPSQRHPLPDDAEPGQGQADGQDHHQ